MLKRPFHEVKGPSGGVKFVRVRSACPHVVMRAATKRRNANGVESRFVVVLFYDWGGRLLVADVDLQNYVSKRTRVNGKGALRSSEVMEI